MSNSNTGAPSDSANLCDLLQPYAGKRRGDPAGPTLDSLRAAAPLAPPLLRDAIESVLRFHAWAEAHPTAEPRSEDFQGLQDEPAAWFEQPEVVEWMRHRQTILYWAKSNCDYAVPALPTNRPGRGDSGHAEVRGPHRPPPDSTPGEAADSLIP